MPQTASAKKALRVSARRRAVNDRWRKNLRSALRQIKDAIGANDKKQAVSLFEKTQSVIDRATRHRIIHPNTAARKKARLTQAINKIK